MASGADPRRSLERLIAGGETLAGLERLLRLSAGYLSKVRRGRVVASPQLAALLDVLLKHPEVRQTLSASSSETKSAPPRGRARGSGPRALDLFVSRIQSTWRESGVRFQGVDDLLLAALKVDLPRGIEPSVRFLVHPDDRRALSAVRALGASVAMAGTRASVCTPPGTDDGLVVVFPLGPLHHLFGKRKLSATDAALYFALQGGEEAERRLRAVAKTHKLDRDGLVRSFRRTYGAAQPLPQKEWLLRATFDPEGALQRLSSLR